MLQIKASKHHRRGTLGQDLRLLALVRRAQARPWVSRLSKDQGTYIKGEAKRDEEAEISSQRKATTAASEDPRNTLLSEPPVDAQAFPWQFRANCLLQC